MMTLRHMLAAACAVCLLSSAAGSARAQDRPIGLGVIDLSFYAVSGAIVEHVLERLGHDVDVVRGPHNVLFPKLAEGKIDLLNAVWLPHAHKTYWQRYGADAMEITTLYDGARLMWAVPDYVPESVVAAIYDLPKLGIVERMDKTIQGTGPGSGLTIRSIAMMDAYGLAGAGYQFKPGSEAQWRNAIRRAFDEKRWIVIPTSVPRFVTHAYGVRALKDTKGSLGESNRVVLAAAPGSDDALSSTSLDVLRRIKLTTDAVAAMDYTVVVDGLTAKAAAQQWIGANTTIVESWF